LRRSQSTFSNYSRHVAAVSLHFGKIPTELDPEQIHDYLFYLQKKSKSPSQSYFKHTVYGLRSLLKSEGLSYDFLSLPEIKKEKKLPVVLSKQEVWQMLSGCKLLKHKILIGLLYGCGLRCLEVRNLRLCDLDFDRKQLKVVQGKGKKDRYLPLSKHLIRGLKKYIEAEKSEDFLFGEPRFDDKDYRQKGIRKQMVLSHEEFIRRFAMHILPKRFVKIRHYGFLSSTWKRLKLKNLQQNLGIQLKEKLPSKTFQPKCSCCKVGNLVTIATFDLRGPPSWFLEMSQNFEKPKI